MKSTTPLLAFTLGFASLSQTTASADILEHPRAIPHRETRAELFFDKAGKVSLRARVGVLLGTSYEIDKRPQKFDREDVTYTGTLFWSGKRLTSKPVPCALKSIDGRHSLNTSIIQCDFQGDKGSYSSIRHEGAAFKVVIDQYRTSTDKETKAIITFTGKLAKETFRSGHRSRSGDVESAKDGRWIEKSRKLKPTSDYPHEHSMLTAITVPTSPSAGYVLARRIGSPRSRPGTPTYLKYMSESFRIRAPIMLSKKQREDLGDGHIYCRKGPRTFKGSKYSIARVVFDDNLIDAPQLHELQVSLDIGTSTENDRDHPRAEDILSKSPGTWTCSFQSGRTKLRTFEIELDKNGTLVENECSVDLGIDEGSLVASYLKPVMGDRSNQVDQPYSARSPRFFMNKMPSSCRGFFY